MSDKITKIRPGRGWFDIDWKEFAAGRELLFLLAKRDVSVIYKQTILGPAWFLIQPVLTSMVFFVVFGILLDIKVSSGGQRPLPRILFYLSGLLLWNYFRAVLQGVSQSFTSAKALFTKVYFPRMVVPASHIVSNIVFLLLNTLVFFGFYAYYVFAEGEPIRPTWWLLGFPVLVVWIGATAMGVGLVVAALTTKYRDLTFSMPFILQVWMYVSPIIFPLDIAKNHPMIYSVLRFNPLGVATEIARGMLMGSAISVQTDSIVCSGLFTLFFLVLGLGMFNRAQRNFVDTI